MPRMAQGRRPTKVREGQNVGALPRMDGAEPNFCGVSALRFFFYIKRKRLRVRPGDHFTNFLLYNPSIICYNNSVKRAQLERRICHVH